MIGKCKKTLLRYGIILLLSGEIFGQNQSSLNFLTKEATLKLILKNLYESSGNKQIELPKIKLVHTTSLAANYNKNKNEIIFEEKLYNICASMGKDSLNSIAYIIAHELQHAIESKTDPVNSFSNFIKTNFSITATNKESELKADIWGSFICYLSGYNPTEVPNRLIDKIYASYHINNSSNTSYYPSSIERKKSIQLMRQQVDGMIQVFELAFILNLESEFELAESCYNYILSNYKGPEIYNNLGITKAFQAMHYYSDDMDLYSYPFEMDVNSMLYKVKKSRGELSMENALLRRRLLENAIDNFYSSLELNPNYPPAYTNIISCMNLLGKNKEAILLFDSLNLKQVLKNNISHESEKLSLAIGISYALSGDDKCKDFFNSCIKSGDLNTKQFSKSNLLKYSKNENKSNSQGCSIQDEFRYSNSNQNNTCVDSNRIILNGNGSLILEYCINPKISTLTLVTNSSSGLIITRHKNNNSSRINLKKSIKSSIGNADLSYVQDKSANYLQCRSGDILYKLNKSNDIVERIKVQKF